MEIQDNVPVYLRLKSALQNEQFLYFQPDKDLALTPEAQSLLLTVNDYFYIKRYFKSGSFPPFSRYFFRRHYRKHRNRFPMLLTKEMVEPSRFTEASPGGAIDRNLVIAYFMEVRDPQGVFIVDRFMRPMEAFALSAKRVLELLPEFQQGTLAPDAQKDEVAHAIAGYVSDLGKLVALFGFVGELFHLSRSANIPQLRTGHLIGVVSGLAPFFSGFLRLIRENGTVLVNHPGLAVALPLLESLAARSQEAVIVMVADMLDPALSAMNCHLALQDGRLRLIDNKPVSEGVVARFLDSILDFLFPPRKDKAAYESLEIVSEKKEKTGKSAQSPQSKAAEAHPAPSPEAKAAAEEAGRIISGDAFQSMLDKLDSFNRMLRSDLEPDMSAQDNADFYRQGFDQFDVEPSRRETMDVKVILKGRFQNIQNDIRYSDKLIVESVYWLYDRVRDILERYGSVKDGIELKKARQLVEEIRFLFYPPKSEKTEAGRYGSFAQFKISLQRLFSDGALQSRYNGLLARLAGQLDRSRDLVQREGQKSGAKKG